jgi:regulator of sirC expression with transglutaminase-like and TPR domain
MTPQAERFSIIVAGDDDEINLVEGTLLVAACEYPGLDVGNCLERIAQLGVDLSLRLRPDISATGKIIMLNRYLFDELGFRANRDDYYDPRNSFLNDVLERKLGIPLTLAIIYMEIGRHIGLPLQGVSFPGHFLVRCALREGAVILDPYARGVSLGIDDLKAASNRDMLGRLLRNLKSIYTQRKDWLKALAIADYIIFLSPGHATEYRDRGLFYQHLECFRAALFDLQSYLEMLPGAEDADTIRQQMIELQAAAARLN